MLKLRKKVNDSSVIHIYFRLNLQSLINSELMLISNLIYIIDLKLSHIAFYSLLKMDILCLV